MNVLAARMPFAAEVPRRVDAALLSALLLGGMYFPTSVGGEFSKPLLGANYVVAFMVLAILAKRYGTAGFVVSLVCISIVPLLLVFTLTSHLNFYTPGSLGSYAVLSLLLILNIRSLEFSDWVFRVFILVNILNMVAIAAVLSGFGPVGQFFTDHYSVFWPDLVQRMLDARKPVLTFASHSIAGFFLYLFFFCALQTWKLKRSRLFLFFAFCYVLALFCLLSVTGLILGALAFGQLNFQLWARSRILVFATVLVVSTGLPVALRVALPDSLSWGDIFETVKATLASPESGPQGRFNPGGTLYYDLVYLRENPLSPVGVSFADQLFFGDSGPVEYLLRGSIPLLIIIYGGYFMFLRRNLLARSEAYLIFGATLAFEVGYSTLTYFRAFYLVPFFVVYLNSLSRNAADLRQSCLPIDTKP